MSATAVVPTVTVAGPTRIALPFGLFSVVIPREGTQHVANGVQWIEDIVSVPDVYDVVYCGPTTPTIDGEGLGSDVSATALTVLALFECGLVGVSVDEGQAKAIDRLSFFAEAALEKALWDGTASVSFASPTSLHTGALDPVAALATLEQGIAEQYGSQGVIHMSRAEATRMLKLGLLTVSGRSLMTKLTTPVVAGTGYDDGTIIGTSQMFVEQSDIFTYSNRAGDLADLKQNNLTAVAGRDYVVGFEPDYVFSVTVEPIIAS